MTPDAAGLSPPVVEAVDLVKSYPGVRALDGASLACRAGRVHALVGENGAGKSTLVRVLTGNVRPDTGELRVDGTASRFSHPAKAMEQGIMAVYQELTVVPGMSIADNILLGHERRRWGLLDRRSQRVPVKEALGAVGLGHVDPSAPAESLSLAGQQLVEIARALVRRTRLLVLDEPSAVLSGEQLQALFGLVRQVAADGVAVLYISHRLDEVRALADEVTVLRDGATVSSGPVEDFPVERMIRDMVGRTVESMFPARSPASGEVVLSVRGLLPAYRARIDPGDPGVDLDVRAGEVVALAGLLGSGRSRLLRTIAGAEPRAGGTVTVGGTRVRPGVRPALQAGICLVPEERKTEGLVLGLPVRANTTLADLRSVAPRGWLAPGAERAAFLAEQQRWSIRATGPDQPTDQLSGGNQQKVVLAKWLRRHPKVVLLDEPTRGIDVGAKSEIYELIQTLAREGLAVIFVSSDLPEVVGLAHRVLVQRRGRVVGELAGDRIDEEEIMHLAFGTEVPT